MAVLEGNDVATGVPNNMGGFDNAMCLFSELQDLAQWDIDWSNHPKKRA